jgi:hypothetical protein
VDLARLALSPGRGYVTEPDDWKKLYKLNKNKDNPYLMRHPVVCSHFVHAVMYAAIEHGTLRTATDNTMDDIFKISPSHLWGQFRRGEGIWAKAGAKCAGLQQKGKLFPLSDPDRIYV